VRLLGVHTAHFGLCERWGVKHRHQDEVGRRRDQDLIIDATGTSASLALALRLVRPRGKVVALAQPAAPMSGDRAILDPDSLALLVSGEAQLLGARGGSLADAMALLARGEIDVVPLITARKKLDDAVSALRLAREPDQLCVMIEL
jgi:threonine dehydrogenase-like Zn-dependent dehydrogenase